MSVCQRWNLSKQNVMEAFNLKLKTLIIDFIIIIWIGIFLRKVSCDSSQSDVMGRIQAVKNKIFKDYDKNIRPTTSANSNTTLVYTGLHPRQILDLDEEKGLFLLDSYFFMVWFDVRLTWKEEDYKGYLQMPKDSIWVPEISVHNSHSSKIDPTTEVLLSIQPSGHVMWMPPVQTQTKCSPQSPTSYPKDEIVCDVIMGAWTHDGWEINFEHSTTVYLEHFENIHPRWELIPSKVTMEKKEMRYDCCPEPYFSLHYRFPLRRRPVPEIEATRIPCILIMVLSLSVYWLPHGSTKKLIVGSLLFLVLGVLLSYVAWSTKYPLSVLYGVSFLKSTMYIVVITVLFQVLVVLKIASFEGPSRPPGIITRLLTGPLGKYLLLRSPFSEDKLTLDRALLNEDSTTTEEFSVKDEWMLFGAAIDRILFLLMVLVAAAIHHL